MKNRVKRLTKENFNAMERNYQKLLHLFPEIWEFKNGKHATLWANRYRVRLDMFVSSKSKKIMDIQLNHSQRERGHMFEDPCMEVTLDKEGGTAQALVIEGASYELCKQLL